MQRVNNCDRSDVLGARSDLRPACIMHARVPLGPGVTVHVTPAKFSVHMCLDRGSVRIHAADSDAAYSLGSWRRLRSSRIRRRVQRIRVSARQRCMHACQRDCVSILCCCSKCSSRHHDHDQVCILEITIFFVPDRSRDPLFHQLQGHGCPRLAWSWLLGPTGCGCCSMPHAGGFAPNCDAGRPRRLRGHMLQLAAIATHGCAPWARIR